MDIAGVVLFVVAAVLGIEWVIAYHRQTGGAWRDTLMGRHAMIFMTSLAAVLALGAARGIAVEILGTHDPTWFKIVRIIIGASVPAVILWRRVLLHRAQRDRADTR